MSRKKKKSKNTDVYIHQYNKMSLCVQLKLKIIKDLFIH